MNISARVQNRRDEHIISLATNDTPHTIDIPPGTTGYGSSVNGGELLFLALATCYCNDIYRCAAKLGIDVDEVDVEVTGEFGAEGEPASGIRYNATVWAHASEHEIMDLMRCTDEVAEIQNTLRRGIPVPLHEIRAIPL